MRHRFSILAAALVAVSAWGGNWKASFGVGYRTFDDVSFAPLQLALPGGSGTYVNGDYIDGVGYTILDDSQLQTAGWTYESVLGGWTRAVTFDQVSYAGGTEGMDDAPGFVLELDRVLATGESGWELGVVLGFAAFWSDMSVTASGSQLATRTFTGTFFEPGGSGNDPGAAYPSAPVTVVVGSGPAMSTPDDLDPAAATTLAQLRLDADLGLYVFSLGLRGTYTVGLFQVAVAGGPTLSVADFSTSVEQMVAFADDGTAAYRSSQSDDTVDVLFGAYVGADVAWMFREGWAVRLGARWDEVFDEVETDQVSIDLSGMTASLALVWMF
jgi:hypothetical protein